jgi:hypothetical protein
MPRIDDPLPPLLKTFASEPLRRNDITVRLELARSPPDFS